MPPNHERDITFTWDTTGVPEGNYTLKAEVPSIPYEVNLDDNILIGGKVWIMTYFHDVAIVEINVTAQNLGDFTEAFDIKAYYNGIVIGSIYVTNLPPRSTHSNFTLDASVLQPCHIYIISEEASLVP
ncbi:MAG: hypothetical protein QXJ07_03735 [Candidatus Bathyarchaeia archaeon]